ncbi:MAG TPA: galactose-1-phosphate uridylyltransferase, partial [Bacilli bacterium]|nr:galactose-1-phosphate uridylyltransferase [Bacilli bacterium]
MDINYHINELLNYGLSKALMTKCDYTYNANVLIALFNRKEFIAIDTPPRDLSLILDDLAHFAFHNHLIPSNDVVTMDNFKAAIMDAIMEKPQTVIDRFQELYQQKPS